MRENQRVMLTKRLLKDSLVALLTQKDIYQISISELCEHAGINRTTFYKYYGSQFDLLKSMEDDMLEHVTNTLVVREDSISAESLICLLEYLDENIQMSRVLINNNVDPDFPRRLFHLPPIRDGLLSLLRIHFEGNDLDYAFTFVIYGCFHMMVKWANKENRESIEQMAFLLLQIIEKVIKEGTVDWEKTGDE